MAWSTSQQVALAMLPKISSVLSLFGSIWISIEVVTDSEIPKLRHPYHRLLLAMSVYDILESVWNFMSTWPIPRDTEGVWDPRGTTQTCTAQGFFLTLSVAVPIYNAFLSLYYMLVINYSYSDRVLRRRVEPAMHVTAFVWAFGTALVSAWMGLINNANLWCWIAPYPSGCKDSRRYGSDQANCERGDNAWIYRWAFYFAPLWFCILVATVCTVKVYSKVHRYDRRSLKYRKPERGSFMGMRWTEQNHQQRQRFSFQSNEMVPAASRHGGGGPSQSSLTPATLAAAARKVRFDDDCRSESSVDPDFASGAAVGAAAGAISAVGATPTAEGTGHDGQPETSSNSCTNPCWLWVSSLPQRFRPWREKRKLFAQDNPRTAEVRQQALWYLITFYLTHVWSTTNRIIQQSRDGKTYFGIIIIHSFFDPLQGFLNFLVYQRPRYLRGRKEHPEWTTWQALTHVLRFSFQRSSNSKGSTKRGTSSVLSQGGGEDRCTHSIHEGPPDDEEDHAQNQQYHRNDHDYSNSNQTYCELPELSVCNVIIEETEKDFSSRSLLAAQFRGSISSNNGGLDELVTGEDSATVPPTETSTDQTSFRSILEAQLRDSVDDSESDASMEETPATAAFEPTTIEDEISTSLASPDEAACQETDVNAESTTSEKESSTSLPPLVAPSHENNVDAAPIKDLVPVESDETSVSKYEEKKDSWSDSLANERSTHKITSQNDMEAETTMEHAVDDDRATALSSAASVDQSLLRPERDDTSSNGLEEEVTNASNELVESSVSTGANIPLPTEMSTDQTAFSSTIDTPFGNDLDAEPNSSTVEEGHAIALHTAALSDQTRSVMDAPFLHTVDETIVFKNNSNTTDQTSSRSIRSIDGDERNATGWGQDSSEAPETMTFRQIEPIIEDDSITSGVD